MGRVHRLTQLVGRGVREAELGTLTKRDWIAIGIGSGLGAAGGYLLVALALPFLLAMIIAVLCAAPAIVLLWLGTLHGKIENRAARQRAATAFDVELKTISAGVSVELATPFRRAN